MCYLSSKYYFYLLPDMPLPTQTWASGFLKEIGGFGIFWGGRDFLSKCLIVQTSYLSERITNKKHPKRARKALQKHVFPAQCLLLVQGTHSHSPWWELHRHLWGDKASASAQLGRRNLLLMAHTCESVATHSHLHPPFSWRLWLD